MPTLKKFLSSVEKKPSSIHGRGVFAKKPIKAGEYASQGAGDMANFVREMNAANSPLAPTWRDLLFGRDDGEGGGEGERDAMPPPPSLGERLGKFRTDFANYAEEERAMANAAERITLSKDGRPSEMSVTNSSDIKRGTELLRAYGPEWLSIKYYHLKANLLIYRTKLTNGDRKFMVFIDPEELFLQDMTIWEDNSKGLGPKDAAKLMSERTGKEIRHISLDELNASANILGMVAHEHFGKGNWLFDSSWKNTQAQLKEQEKQK